LPKIRIILADKFTLQPSCPRERKLLVVIVEESVDMSDGLDAVVKRKLDTSWPVSDFIDLFKIIYLIVY
jgi:hypothetical protein